MEHARFLFACLAKNTISEAEVFLQNLSDDDSAAAAQFQVDLSCLRIWADEHLDASLSDAAMFLAHMCEHMRATGPWQLSLLALSVWKGSLAMVDLLLRNGADIDVSPMDDEEEDNSKHCLFYAPIVVASSRANMDILKLLLERGADVKSHRGLHCIYRCSKNEELMRLLVAHGADINGHARWTDHAPLLHFAISSNENIALIKRQLDVGADPRIRYRYYNEDALQHACQCRRQDVVDLLLEAMGLGLKDKINSRLLLGAGWIHGDVRNNDTRRQRLHYRYETHAPVEKDVTKAALYWTEAMELLSSAQPAVTMDRHSVPTAAFGIKREPGTIEELQQLLAQPFGADRYAMLIREQLIGPCTYCARVQLKSKAKECADMGEYTLAINFYFYLLAYYTTPNPAVFDIWGIHDSLYTLCLCDRHLSLQSRRTTRDSMLTEFRSIYAGLESHALQRWADDGIELMEKVVAKMSTIIPNVEYGYRDMIYCMNQQRNNSDDRDKESHFDLSFGLILIAIFLLEFMLKLTMSKDVRDKLRKATVELARNCSAYPHIMGSLLSYASRDRVSVTPDVFQYLLLCSGDLPISVFRSCLDEALLSFADELQAISMKDNVPAGDKSRAVSEIRPYALLLLRSGAHSDARSASEESTATIFSRLLPDFDMFPYETLQCLAARVVRRLDDPRVLAGVPQMIVDFVNTH